jgi:hypothetical protein
MKWHVGEADKSRGEQVLISNKTIRKRKKEDQLRKVLSVPIIE